MNKECSKIYIFWFFKWPKLIYKIGVSISHKFLKYLPTFLFRTSSPCRWFIWRKEPLELTALTGLTARTGLLKALERTLTSSVTPHPKCPALLTPMLLTEKDLWKLSSVGDLPAVGRSVWDLALIDISVPDGCNSTKASLFDYVAIMV